MIDIIKKFYANLSKYPICLKILKFIKIVISPLLLFLTIEVFYKNANSNMPKKAIFASYILAICIFIVFYLFALSILKTTFITNVVFSAFFFILLIVNQFKIIYSSEPIFIADLGYLNTPGTFADILDGNIIGTLLSMLGLIIVMLLMFASICVLSYFFNTKVNINRNRIVLSLLTLSMILVLFLPVEAINIKFIDAFYTPKIKNKTNTTSTIKYYQQHSFIGGIYGQYLVSMLRKPANYDENMLKDILDKSALIEGNKEWGTPNIIMIFSETFWDMDEITEVEFDRNITPNFDRLKEEGLVFDMISPVLGGYSANPEFEMLTGGGLKFFPKNYVPSMNLYTNKEAYKKPSVIKELKNNNYYTKIVSAWDKSLFNVENVYEYFGVDETLYLDDLPNKVNKGKYLSDAYVADMIIADMKAKELKNPMFYMYLTAQAHMPYDENKYSSYDINVVNSTLSPFLTGTVKSYAQGIYDADAALGRIYDFIQTYDEPTIIIFYGDHLPFLRDENGALFYDKFAQFSNLTEEEYLYKTYHTKGLILSNYDIKHEEDINYLSYDLVMSYVLNNMDIEVSPFYKWLNTTKYDLPAANQYVAVDKNGKIYNINDLPENMKEMFKLREQMNWYQFVD